MPVELVEATIHPPATAGVEVAEHIRHSSHSIIAKLVPIKLAIAAASCPGVLEPDHKQGEAAQVWWDCGESCCA